MMFGAIAVSLAIEYFLSGATAAITLYCGTKLPRKKGNLR